MSLSEMAQQQICLCCPVSLAHLLCGSGRDRRCGDAAWLGVGVVGAVWYSLVKQEEAGQGAWALTRA